MLIAKNNKKVLKKALCLIFALILSINSFGAIVSDNDGSAFVTKAEFEELKKNFSTQIDNYNTSIDSKIDGAIASYLSGIKINKQEVIKTGLTIQGDKNTIEFLGKSKILNNSVNEVWTSANVFCCIVTGYSPYDWWYQDMQHILALKATWNDGHEDNVVFERDGNYIKKIYNNIKVLVNNSASGYGANSGNFNYGGLWAKLKLTITEPMEDDLKGNHSSEVWPYEREIEGIGFTNFTSHKEKSLPGYINHSDDIGYLAGTGKSCVWWTDPKDVKNNVKCADAIYSCSWTPENVSAVQCHWPWGIDNTMRVKQIIRDATGTIMEKSHYRFVNDQTYTNTVIVNSRTGSAFNLNRNNDTCTEWPLTIEDTGGYVVYLNTNLENIGDYYYQELKDVENVDEKLSHGFYLCSNDNHEGYVELTLQSDTNNTKVFFSKNGFPLSMSDDFLDCELYNQSTHIWEPNKTPVLTTKDTQYKIRVNFDASVKKIYFAVAGFGDDINNFDIKITQVGDAILNVA